MFNLIVSNKDWETGHFEFREPSRIFEYTSKELVDRFGSEQGPDFDALKKLPTLFMQEGRGQELARLGRVTKVQSSYNAARVSCEFDDRIPRIRNQQLFEMAQELDIDEWEFSRNHWAVKDIDVFQALLRRDVRRRLAPQVFQLSEHENVEANLVSVMMPFDAGFNSVHKKLEDLCGELGHECKRADDIWENEQIIQDIVSLIDRSQVVIADCTRRNPNVLYEIGIAHTLGRNVLMITQNPDDIPFDLRHLRFVTYLNNAEGRNKLADDLRDRLEQFK